MLRSLAIYFPGQNPLIRRDKSPRGRAALGSQGIHRQDQNPPHQTMPYLKLLRSRLWTPCYE